LSADDLSDWADQETYSGGWTATEVANVFFDTKTIIKPTISWYLVLTIREASKSKRGGIQIIKSNWYSKPNSARIIVRGRPISKLDHRSCSS
jgi:hypothetical protein